MQIIKRIIRYVRLIRDSIRVKRSKLFDEKWYLDKNPDIAQKNINAVHHYIQYGGFEGRDPSPGFSSKSYLEAYPDIKNARVNPLLHYFQYGKNEGRYGQPDNDQIVSGQSRFPVGGKKNSDSFLINFISEIISNLNNNYTDNYDYARFGPNTEENKKINFKSFIDDSLRKLNNRKQDLWAADIQKGIQYIDPYLLRFENLYKNLADLESKQILLKVLAYRVLGYQKVRLPLNVYEYKMGVEKISKIADLNYTIPSTWNDAKLCLVDLNQIGISIKVYGTPAGIHHEFVLQQYRCLCENDPICVEGNDIVIDAGACWGETSLYFTHLNKPHGKTYSIEFLPQHLNILKKNISINPNIIDRIEIIENALWSKSNLEMDFQNLGPGTTINPKLLNNKDGKTATITIDDLVNSRKLERVDFIKMDIEGAEYNALKGAEKTIKKYKPKLAISLYHQLKDFLDIPEYIKSLNPSYEIYIRHFTIHSEETVLFARVINND